MAKWRCTECVDDGEASEPCVLDICDGRTPETCPYDGTDCKWQPLDDDKGDKSE